MEVFLLKVWQPAIGTYSAAIQLHQHASTLDAKLAKALADEPRLTEALEQVSPLESVPRCAIAPSMLRGVVSGTAEPAEVAADARQLWREIEAPLNDACRDLDGAIAADSKIALDGDLEIANRLFEAARQVQYDPASVEAFEELRTAKQDLQAALERQTTPVPEPPPRKAPCHGWEGELPDAAWWKLHGVEFDPELSTLGDVQRWLQAVLTSVQSGHTPTFVASLVEYGARQVRNAERLLADKLNLDVPGIDERAPTDREGVEKRLRTLVRFVTSLNKVVPSTKPPKHTRGRGGRSPDKLLSSLVAYNEEHGAGRKRREVCKAFISDRKNDKDYREWKSKVGTFTTDQYAKKLAEMLTNRLNKDAQKARGAEVGDQKHLCHSE